MDRTLAELLCGNAAHASAFESRFDGVQDSQSPAVVTVTCSDSRVLADHLWSNDEPGRIFTCCTIGNRVVERTDAGRVVSGDVHFPVEHTGTKLVVVVGHTGCGAVTAAYDALADGRAEPPGIARCIDLLKPHLEPGVDSLPSDLSRTAAVNHLVEYNVDAQVAFLVESDELPADVTVVGAVYDFQDAYGGRRGEVHLVNVDGERDVERLRAAYPDLDSRTRRLWEY